MKKSNKWRCLKSLKSLLVLIASHMLKRHAAEEGRGMEMRDRQGRTWWGVCGAREEGVAGRYLSNPQGGSGTGPVSSLGACWGCWPCKGLPSPVALTHSKPRSTFILPLPPSKTEEKNRFAQRGSLQNRCVNSQCRSFPFVSSSLACLNCKWAGAAVCGPGTRDPMADLTLSWVFACITLSLRMLLQEPLSTAGIKITSNHRAVVP